MSDPRRSIPVPRIAHAFSLVELLVVVSIIVILLAILIPASTLVLGSARESSNQSLLKTLADGAYAFNTDFGYYPPLLSPQPGLATEVYVADNTDSSRSASARADALERIRWHSVLTPAVYLLGVGELAPDEASLSGTAPAWLTDSSDPNYENRHDGAAGLGIRAPGPDRSWGGGADRRNHRPSFIGRVYGPYIDPKIGETQVRPVRLEDFTTRSVSMPPLTQADVEQMQLSVIVDRFDSPIRYYKDWPQRDTSVAASADRAKTLVDAPLELLKIGAVRAFLDAENATDPLDDSDLFGRPAAFLSAGTDGRWGERKREEVPQEDLLTPREVRDLDADDQDLKRVLEALEDNQRALPE